MVAAHPTEAEETSFSVLINSSFQISDLLNIYGDIVVLSINSNQPITIYR